MEKLAENMQKMTEDDLLLVVQMIHDNKTADTWTKNDVDREHSIYVPAWYVRANELPQRASSKWISTHFQTVSYASFGTSRTRRSFGSKKNILAYHRYLEWNEAFKRLHHYSLHPSHARVYSATMDPRFGIMRLSEEILKMADFMRMHFMHDKHCSSCTKSLSEKDKCCISSLLHFLGRWSGPKK